MAQQFENVSARYGAPMGRRANGYLETDVPRFVRLFNVKLDSGGYDDGGAYWGQGEPLFCAIDGDGSRKFVRATHRTKAAFLLDIPNVALKIAARDFADYGFALIDGRAPMPSGKNKTDAIEWLQRSGVAMGQCAN